MQKFITKVCDNTILRQFIVEFSSVYNDMLGTFKGSLYSSPQHFVEMFFTPQCLLKFYTR